METVCLHSPCKCPPARNSDYCCDACSSADMSGGSQGRRLRLRARRLSARTPRGAAAGAGALNPRSV